MPVAKNIGAVTNSWNSGFVAAQRVSDDITEKLIPSILANSDAMYSKVMTKIRKAVVKREVVKG